MGIPTFKYEKIELLVCIYEISRELVFIYEIAGCSQCLTVTPVTIVNHYHIRRKALKQGTGIYRKHVWKLESGLWNLNQAEVL